MKDIKYAGFAQLSYLDWHKLNNVYKGTKLNSIFGEKKDAFNQIVTDSYIEMYGGFQDTGKAYREQEQKTTGTSGYILNVKKEKKEEIKLEKDYLELINGKKIYDANDARLFYFYSEHPKEPNDNPMYKEFANWQFIYGYDHDKVENEMKIKGKNELNGLWDSGFQASVFKNGNEIIIAIRGSDSFKKAEHLNDWILTNYSVAMMRLPEAVICALWLYDKVKKEYPSCKIHVTGHSMGAALAQYVGVYGGYQVAKVVTWNGLGINLPSETILWTNSKKTYFKILGKNWKDKNGIFNNIINYNISRDLVGSFKTNIGKVKSTDTGSEKNKAILEEDKELFNDIMEWVTSEEFWTYMQTGSMSLLFKSIFPKNFDPIVHFIKKGVKLANIIDRVTILREKIKKEKMAAAYHSMNNFMPFFQEGNITPKRFNNNFVLNSYKQVYKINGKNDVNNLDFLSDKEKMGGNLYYYLMPNYNSESYLDFFKLEQSKFDEQIVKDKKIKIGGFNNMSIIAGVSGGEPLKVETKVSSAKTFTMYQLGTHPYEIVRSTTT